MRTCEAESEPIFSAQRYDLGSQWPKQVNLNRNDQVIINTHAGVAERQTR
jgi:hypothetical protein